MILDRGTLAMRKLAGGNSGVENVLLEKRHDGKYRAVATAGFYMGVLEDVENGMRDDDFPVVPGAPTGDAVPKRVLLRPETMAAAEKAIDAKSARQIPILGCARLVMADGPENEQQPAITVTDLENGQTFRARAVKDDSFPSYEHVIPKGEITFRVTLNVKYLAELVAVAKAGAEYAGKEPHATLEFYGTPGANYDHKPIGVKVPGAERFTGVLMSART